MAHVQIISSQTAGVIFEGAPRYVGAYLKPGYLEFQAIGSPTPIPWHTGDQVTYARTGKVYRLYRTPQSIEQGESNLYGASFLYENVQFFDDSKQLEFCPFTDLVPGDNTIHFSTQNVVSFFGKPLNVAERIQACLENQYGAGTWEVRIVTTTDADLLEILNTETEFSVSGVSCLGVLDKVYEVWGGLGWVHTVENGKNIITIGASNERTEDNTTVPFAYGNGLVRIERSIANADEIGTRLYAYGSMKNMDATYYRGLDIKDAESVDIEHLMIPISNWGTTDNKPDARKAFIEDASAIANLGLIPRTAYFDGTGDLPDIHPTIERMTIGEVYDAGGAGYIPDLSKWSRDQRVDEVISATNPDDHGTSAEQGQKYAEIIDSHLLAVSASGEEGAIGQDIWTGTTTKAGRLTLQLGQNLQTFTVMSGWTNPVFSNIHIEVHAQGAAKYIAVSVFQTGTNTWAFRLPESITLNEAGAGTVRIYLSGYVFRASEDDYAGYRTYTFATDSSTVVSASVEYELARTFVLRIPQIGFDIDDYAALGNGKTISMKTGMCAGRDFEIKDAAYVSSADAWDLTIYRSVDEDLNIMFPNVDYEIAAGDQYVLLDIAMPDMYVAVASSRLLSAAQKLLSDISVEQPFYAPQIDAKIVYNESRILREGMWMHIQPASGETDPLESSDPADLQEQLGLFLVSSDTSRTDAYVLIDSIIIDENGSNIPTYEVTLRERKGIEWTENIGKSSSSRSSKSVSGDDAQSDTGTVTSVGLEVPQGLSVEGSPITSAGTIKINTKPGYKIPLESELGSYFEPSSALPSLIQPKTGYSYLGAKEGIFFSGGDTSTPLPDIYVDTVQDSGGHDVRVLRTPLALISGGDQIVGDGTPGGGGGGGGAASLYELTDVYGTTAVLRADGSARQAGDILEFNGTLTKWVAAPTVRSVVGQTGAVTAAQIATALTNAGYKLTDTMYSNATTSAAGLMSAADKTKLDGITSTKISHWDTAYSWGNHASAGYLLATTAANTYVAKAGDTMTGDLIISKAGGGNLILRGTEANRNGGTLYFYGRYYSGNPRNGAKLAAEYPGSGAYDIQDLVFYVSRNRTDATPTWEEALRIASTKDISMPGTLTIGEATIEWVPNSGNGYLRINKPLLTSGDQIVSSGTPGGGSGGGGAGYVYELGDVLTDSSKTHVKQADGTTNAANGNLFAYNGSKWYALRLGSNLAISDGVLNATDTRYTAGTGLALSNGQFSVSSAYQTNISHGQTAYGWGNHADAGYVLLATAQTISAKHTFSAGLLLNAANSWSNTDRALYFSASDEMANLRYYSTDASKGLMFNPYSGALKAGSFVKLGGGSGFLKADGTEDPTAYLPLTGGTMTGDIKMTNGEFINAASGYAMLGVGSGGSTFYCGPGNEITTSFLIRSGDINLTHVRNGANCTIWDAANSNLSTVDWAARNLSVAGTSSFSDTMYVENRTYMYWKDSGGTSRNVFGLNNADNLLIGYGLTSVAGSVVALYGETIRMNATSVTELVKTGGGATLILRGSALNNAPGTILFRGGTSESNGFKIEAEPYGSYGRVSLSFYSSNVSTGDAPYTPDWKRSMRIYYNGNIHFGNDGTFFPTIYSYGPIVIGTTTNNASLTVRGTITSTGDQVISSDATKKKNWRDLKYGVADIAKATAGVFDWKDGKGESAGTKAQDWMHIIPQLVHGEEGHMTLAYGQIAMLNTILLARRSEDHESRIKALEEENAELRKEIERLRS